MQHIVCVECDHHRVELATLRFVYGHSICERKLVDIAIFVNRHFIVIKTHGKLHNLRIYAFNHAYIAVENAASAHGLKAVRLRPFLLIIVLKLHNLVALAINAIRAFDFSLMRRGRIDYFLQLFV